MFIDQTPNIIPYMTHKLRMYYFGRGAIPAKPIAKASGREVRWMGLRVMNEGVNQLVANNAIKTDLIVPNERIFRAVMMN